jgi:hypothetical protein
MAPHYERVRAELGVVHPSHIESIPNHTSHAWRANAWFDPIAEERQYPFALLFPEQNGGRMIADRMLSELNGEDGLFGSAGAAKANVETVYWLPHLETGVMVHEMHEKEAAEACFESPQFLDGFRQAFSCESSINYSEIWHTVDNS